MVSRAAASVDSLYRPTETRNTIVIMGGANDASNGISPAQTWANLAQYASDRHKIGWKVILASCLSPDQSIIALEQANWPGVFDGFANIGADPNLGCVGCNSNPTYFQMDDLHPTPFASQTIISPLISNSINLLG